MRSSKASGSHTTELRQVTCSIHPGPCQPCILCKKGNQSKYFHPKTWKDPLLLTRLQEFEPSLNIQPTSCICRQCRNDVSKLNDDSIIPRWRKSNSTKYCFVPGCTNVDIKVTKTAERETLRAFFAYEGAPEQRSRLPESQDDTGGTPLCSCHYMQWYRHIHPSHSKCKTCAKNITDTSKSRPVPEPQLLQKFLNENTEFTGELYPDDRVCYSCYRSHLITIKHIIKSVHSSDSDLQDVISKIRQSIPHTAEINTYDTALKYVVRLLAINLGEALLKQTAMLLPQLYTIFREKLVSITDKCGISINQDLPSHAWLRSELSSLLEHHMTYKCSVPRYGTLLYRYEGDLVHALSVSLSQGHSTIKDEGLNEDSEKLSRACLTLNAKFHTQINTMIEQDTLSPHTIEDVDIDKFIDSLDPDIWRSICLLTQPSTSKATTTHVRKIRRFFCICTLLFTINRQCSFPIHTLMSDAIETYGGSSRLLRLFNRLGVCASPETHARYVQYRVQKRNAEGPMAEYPADAFMIVSADNLDFIHKYSRVYCGKQGSSWHGTTVQIVQPKPTSLIDTTQSEINLMSSRQNVASCLHTNDPKGPDTSLVKRLYSTRSPLKNPVYSSPCPKRIRRRRTGVEDPYDNFSSSTSTCAKVVCDRESLQRPSMEMSTFLLKTEEENALNSIRKVSEQYILLKVASNTHTNPLIHFQMYYSLSCNIPAPESSNIIYYKVLDEKCDNKETLLSVINDLYTEFILSGSKKFVLLEGDQATYERLQSLKAEYGNDSSWLVPFPGDWHFLKNFQEVLIKIYFDAGLSELAVASGYHPKSIGTNFKRTHLFFLEVWESFYRIMMCFYLSKVVPNDFLENVSHMIKNFPQSELQTSALRNLNEMVEDISEKVKHLEQFSTFIDNEAQKNPTLHFWCQFVFKDCFAYIALYLAIRSGNWDLRVAALKQMAALFTAFDRPKYSKLNPHHLVEMYTIPEEVLTHLKQGGFTVSILSRPCHSVGIDEAHEMCINRECKEYITRPSADYINRTAVFLPIRATAISNFEKQVFSDSKPKVGNQIKTIHASDPESKKLETNVKCQMNKLNSGTSVLTSSNSITLQHLFNHKPITPEQAHDLTNFRDIGQNEYERRIDYYILRTPSVKPPKHRKSLLTFTQRITRRKKGSQVERERKLQIECWKKRVAFAAATGIQANTSFQQCIELPRAIATIDGNPVKGAKSNTTKFFEKRYEQVTPSIILTSLKEEWIPDTVVMEGMFLINITPWSAHKTIGDYADFLLKQHILPHFRNMSREVHLLFDDPECQQHSPKYFERQSRDHKNQVPDDHSCNDFSQDLMIPPKWRNNVINCRKCKRNLICFLSHYFLQRIKHRLKPNQRFVTAGGFEGAQRNKALSVSNGTQPDCDDRLICNAEESDTRIWLHVINSAGTKKLVLSPDTDVYHIGLPIISQTDLDVVVRLSPFSSLEHRLLDMQALIKAFNNDPELAGIDSTQIASVMQMIFISTGCDFISFFNGFGKATFLATFFQYSDFISSNSINAPGTLANNDLNSSGLLSFMRLVGCAYFKKHKAAFLPSFPTPMTLYNSLSSSGQEIHLKHSAWLDLIRDRIWSRIQYEEDMIPSHDALLRHWKRSCWVSSVWRQATSNHITYPPLHTFGWKQPDPSTIVIDWDSESNTSQIRERVAFIRKGCCCRTGCKSARCKCKKNSHHCGPGCKCTACTNLPFEASTQVTEDGDAESTASSTDGSDTESNDLDEEVDKIMTDIFGSSDYDEELQGDVNMDSD